MMRSSVLLPEPDWPSSATISPLASVKSTCSSTERRLPSADLKPLATFFSSINAVMAVSLEMHPVFGDAVQPPPDPVVERHHEDAHDTDAERDAREVARGRHLLDVA